LLGRLHDRLQDLRGVGTALAHRVDERLRVHGADAVVDVEAVRVDPDRHHFGAEFMEDRRRNVIRGAMRAVDDQLQPAQVECMRKRALAELDVAAGRVLQPARLAEAVRIEPDFAIAHNNFGILLAQLGNLDAAIKHYTEAVRIDPGYASARHNLARTLVEADKVPAAITHFREATRLRPNWISPMNNLALILATYEDPEFRNGAEAVWAAERACELANYERPELLGTLAAAYAAAGRFSDAVAAAEGGLELARSSGLEGLSEEIQDNLSLFKAQQPYIVRVPKIPSD